MKYYTIPPPPSLSSFVRFFWVLEYDMEPGARYVQRVMADGCAELLFHYRGRFDEAFDNDKTEKSFSAGLHGQSMRYRRFQIGQSFGIFGAYLYPYAVPALLNISAAEVVDQMPDLQELLGSEGRALEETTMLAPDNRRRMQVVSAFLYRKLCRSKAQRDPFYAVVDLLIESKGRMDLARLADRACLSVRQFERRFKELVGFSPKQYARVIRFQSVFDGLSSASGQSLTSIAHACGYYDQSHFIHDFKRFSGFSPKQFLQDKSTETVIWANAQYDR